MDAYESRLQRLESGQADIAVAVARIETTLGQLVEARGARRSLVLKVIGGVVGSIISAILFVHFGLKP